MEKRIGMVNLGNPFEGEKIWIALCSLRRTGASRDLGNGVQIAEHKQRCREWGNWGWEGGVSHVAKAECVGRKKNLERGKFKNTACSQTVETLECWTEMTWIHYTHTLDLGKIFKDMAYIIRKTSACQPEHHVWG